MSEPAPAILPSEEAPASAPFSGYLVCIGASAGGLGALESFFRACSADSGAAFVVVQHLSPDHKSMMASLLARHTTMPVVTVENDMQIAANHVYLIPPGSVMHVSDARLRLSPKNPRGLTLPIDIFLHSLATVYGRHAVGVILSGTGTDGSRGVVSINAAGGFVMVQDPETSAFDGMPRSAIATGVVDAVLEAEALPVRLLAHLRDPHAVPVPASAVDARNLSADDTLGEVLQLVHQSSGVDFSEYKPTTVLRRIERRQQVRHTQNMSEYLNLLRSDPNEVMALRREVLISVSSFFRDPDTFSVLAEQVIAPLVASRDAGDTIRVWVAGVATGEEAYTIAMLFREAFEAQRRWPRLKIFATDLDQGCIEQAGLGQYPESASAELSGERLERFFVRNGDRFVVKSELRQCIVFARHNLLADPPFTRMDLVSCRNTLIYFKNRAQERALRSLQYALNEGGVLLLGPSESLAANAQSMDTVDQRAKLFRRHGKVPTVIPERHGGVPLLREAQRFVTRNMAPPSVDHAETAQAMLMSHYVPPAILVNERQEAVHMFGDVSPYFQPRDGAASLVLSRLLPEVLVPVASALVYKATRDGARVYADPLALPQADGSTTPVRLVAHPVGTGEGGRLTLLCFEQHTAEPPAAPTVVSVGAEAMARINRLEHELAATRENLQATIEELETSNEELQATNEELMASNEELQSSNEELQSVNEEMNTVNAEFQEKLQQIDRIHADLESMTRALGEATVFIDARQHITRFSPDATRVFKLRDTDLGRPLDDIAHNLVYPDLMADLRLTASTHRLIEREVGSTDGKANYLARMLPYRIASLAEPGVVITFIDVTSVRNLSRLQAIVDALPEHLAVLDGTGTIIMVNAAWERFARANGDPDLLHTGVGTNYMRACRNAAGIEGSKGDGTAREAETGLRSVLEGTLSHFSMEYPCHSPAGQRWFVMNAAPLGAPRFGAVVSHVNITAWRHKAAP